MQAYRSPLLLHWCRRRRRREETHRCFLGDREKQGQGLEPMTLIRRDCVARRYYDDRMEWEIPCLVVVLLVVLVLRLWLLLPLLLRVMEMVLMRLYGVRCFFVFRCSHGICCYCWCLTALSHSFYSLHSSRLLMIGPGVRA